MNDLTKEETSLLLALLHEHEESTKMLLAKCDNSSDYAELNNELEKVQNIKKKLF